MLWLASKCALVSPNIELCLVYLSFFHQSVGSSQEVRSPHTPGLWLPSNGSFGHPTTVITAAADIRDVVGLHGQSREKPSSTLWGILWEYQQVLSRVTISWASIGEERVALRRLLGCGGKSRERARVPQFPLPEMNARKTVRSNQH